MDDFLKAGVQSVVQPELEAGLAMTRQALFFLDLPAAEIQIHLEAMHREGCAPLLQEE